MGASLLKTDCSVSRFVYCQLIRDDAKWLGSLARAPAYWLGMVYRFGRVRLSGLTKEVDE